MISRFYKTTFTIYRMVWTGDSSSTLANQGTFSGHIQQAQPQLLEHYGGNLSDIFTVWCDEGTDIEEGDRITTNGNGYRVKAINTRNYISSSNSHLELVVTKEQDYASV